MSINEFTVRNDMGNIKQKAVNCYDKKSPFKIMATIIVGFMFILILIPGISYHLFLFIFFGLFALISFTYPDIGLMFIAIASSFAGLMRWKDFTDPLLAGFNTIMLIIYFWAISCRYFIIKNNSSRINLFVGKKAYAIVLYVVFATIILLAMVAYWRGFVSFAMMAREYLIPIMLLPFAIYAIDFDFRKASLVLYGLFGGAAVAAIFNIIHYYIGLPLNEPQYVLVHGSDTSYYVRSILGVNFPRLNHILSFSQQGAAAVYYTVFALVGLFLSKQTSNIIQKTLIFIGIIALLFASLLTVSYSMLVVLVLVMLFFYLSSIKRVKKVNRAFIVMPVIALIIFILMANIITVSRELTLWEYIFEVRANTTISLLMNMDPYEMLFGNRLGIKSGGMLGISDQVIVDHWLFVVLYQLGLIAFIIMLALFFMIYSLLIGSIRNTSISTDRRRLLMSIGIILVGYLGYAHGAMIIERLFSTSFVIALAILLSFHQGNKKQNKL